MTERGRELPVVRSGVTLRQALGVLDRCGIEIAVIVDHNERVLGVITDGDVRRSLLRGITLEDPVETAMNSNYIAVDPSVGRAEVLDLMRARRLEQVPVIGDAGELIGIHVLRELVGAIERDNWGVIMAGGRGERLRPLTDATPKPMLHVAGRPILERLILHLVGFGVRNVFLAVNYRADLIENHFGDGSAFGCSIDYLRERVPLGTGGALSLLPRMPETPVVVLNGDLVTQFDVAQMLSVHSERGHKATVGVHEHLHTVPFGVVDVDGERVVELREKPTQSWQVNAGVYVLSPDLIPRVPRDKHFPLPSLIEDCLERGERVGIYRTEDEWIDVGRHQELKRARGEMDKP
jgi:dTDP-glucose pyrophosphorylase/CBS domain-containing protein